MCLYKDVSFPPCMLYDITEGGVVFSGSINLAQSWKRRGSQALYGYGSSKHSTPYFLQPL